MKNIFLILIVCALSSCATILGGSRANVKIHNLPENAVVYYNGVNKGHADKVKVYRKTPGSIKIVADSCVQEITFSKRPAYGFIVLDLATTGIPLIFDLIAGNLSRPAPKHIQYECTEVKK